MHFSDERYQEEILPKIIIKDSCVLNADDESDMKQ